MGIVTLDLPIVGQPNTTEDVKIRNNFSTLANTINGNIDGSNLSPGILSQLGNFQKINNATVVSDIGSVGQIRAGRILTPADFTNMGLSAPLGLWNLSNVNDSSGNARNLTNKGSVTFDTGITGAGSESAVFTGSTAQALYIVDTGGADPFRIKTGSWGCWFRTAKRVAAQHCLAKAGTAGTNADTAWLMRVETTNSLIAIVSDGTNAVTATGTSDVADDRWHFGVATADGSRLRIYVDGALEGSVSSGSILLQPLAKPFNIGGEGADGSTAAVGPHYGRVDEAFVTADVLSDSQVLNLYCASFAHTLGAVPSGTRLGVRRRKRGGTLTVSNFPATPVRLHNFTASALTDEGSGAVGLTSNPGTGAIVSVAGADGSLGNGYSFSGAHTGMSATDTGLPSGTSARSFGCWHKSGVSSGGLVGWGTYSANSSYLYQSGVNIASGSGADVITGPYIIDNLWHFSVVVEDNAAADGVKRKLYTDGRLVGGSTVLTSITLAGANRLRVGAVPDGTLPFAGQIDGAFIYAGVLNADQVKTLYNVGSQQLALSPKASEDHIEALELTRVLGKFDALEGSDMVDLAVIA